MMHRIYKMTDKAADSNMTWDEAIYNCEIETVVEYDSIEAALEAFENEFGGNDEMYGVE